MWRREEELGYWLAGDHPSPKPDLAFKLKTKLQRKLGVWQFPNIVRDQSLLLETKVICLDEELAATADVCDGLSAISQWAYDEEAASAIEGQRAAMHHVDLIGAATVRNLRMPDERQARIHQAKLLLMTNARTLQVKLNTGDVHALECFKNQPVDVKNGEQMLIKNPGIGALVSGIAALPHMRKSLNVDDLPDSERESFLREAEFLKHLPVDRAELVAVFRHVPIEAISRLHFLAEKRIILYSISRVPKRSKTRVHDMAAVRDTANQEIHLVPHRTRFRLVSLN